VLKHDKNNAEARTILGELNKRTMFSSSGGRANKLLSHVKTVYTSALPEPQADEVPKFPIKIRAINKPFNKRSKVS